MLTTQIVGCSKPNYDTNNIKSVLYVIGFADVGLFIWNRDSAKQLLVLLDYVYLCTYFTQEYVAVDKNVMCISFV